MYESKSAISRSDMTRCSDLSYMESKNTVSSATKKWVITLAPPLLPFPFEATANLILKQLPPSGMPRVGSSESCIPNKVSSFLSEGYFFASRFICLSKGGMDATL